MLEATTTHMSPEPEQGSDLGGSGSTVELRRNHGENCAVGQTDGRTDRWQDRPEAEEALCLGNQSREGPQVYLVPVT